MSSGRRPTQATRGFLGRADELALAARLFAAGERLLVFRGVPGVGKSRLARVFAGALAEGGATVRSVSLADSRDRDDILGELARAAGLHARTADARVLLDRLVARLERDRAVVVIDDVAGTLAPLATLLEDLLDATDEVGFVVASEVRLEAPSAFHIPVAPLPPRDAAALLLDRVARRAPALVVPPAVADRLARACGGLPLAIDLVATRVATLGAADVEVALGDGDLGLDALDRAMDRAAAALSAPAHAALLRLSVFRGDFDGAEAAALVFPEAPRTEALGQPPIAAVLDELAGASLVSGAESASASATSFSMNASVRRYAQRRAQVEGVLAEARRRHAMLLSKNALPRADDAFAWESVRRRREDLLDAWRWAVLGEPVVAARLAVTIDTMLLAEGSAHLHREVLERTLAALDDATNDAPSDLERVDIHLALGRLDAVHGACRRGLVHFDSALRLAERAGDPPRTGWALAFRSFALSPLGELEEARRAGELALSRGHDASDRRLVAMSEVVLAREALAARDTERALGHTARAQAVARTISAPRVRAIAAGMRAYAESSAGRPEDARTSLVEARQLFEEVGDKVHLARVASQEGAVALQLGRLEEAEALLARALDAVVEQGDAEGQLETIHALCELALARGREHVAERRLEELVAVETMFRFATWSTPIAELRVRVDAALRGSAAGPVALLRTSRDGRTVLLRDEQLDFGRRGPLRRILLALVERRLGDGASLTVLDLQRIGWPGEKMLADSGAARVYMAIRRLRDLGLEPILQTSDEGYRLAPGTVAPWLESGEAGSNG
ncbi:MAG: tetratricopeptide repeat protein [Deltaproteobacteria bacterium]|nr:tetratricopeptide repeat protein [Deltaproteobacteria bacterium]